MVIKKTVGDKIFDICNIVLLTVLTIAALYPFLYVVFASMSDSNQLAKYTGMLYKPIGFSLEAYKAVLKNPDIAIGYRNTIFYVVAGTAFSVIMTSIGAFAISRKNFLWKKPIMIMIIITMYFNGGLVPTYLLIKGLGMLNSVWAVILPGAISAMNMFIMRTSFQAIPDSLEESAKLDGATDFTILFKIILPLSMPVISVMCLYYGVAQWNSWFGPMIYLTSSRNLYPLQLFLREILITASMSEMTQNTGSLDAPAIEESIKYATIIAATLPILCVYPFLQKYFVKGIMIGALKG